MSPTSTKLDLVSEARAAVAPSAATVAALVIHRLKQHPTAPDGVVWHATATELDRQGHDVDSMHDRYPSTDPSLVTSLLRESDHYDAPSEVVV